MTTQRESLAEPAVALGSQTLIVCGSDPTVMA